MWFLYGKMVNHKSHPQLPMLLLMLLLILHRRPHCHHPRIPSKVAMPFSRVIDSLRYHLLHPDYLYYRIRKLQKNFKLCVVLCHVDAENVGKPLFEVTRTTLLHDCTLLCAWSLEECGRPVLGDNKNLENKPADLIQGEMDTDYLSRVTHALTSIRHVNKTDADMQSHLVLHSGLFLILRMHPWKFQPVVLAQESSR